MRRTQEEIKRDRDVKNSLDTAKEEGKEEEKRKIAEKCLRRGMSIIDTADITDLSEEEIQRITDKINR